MKKLIKKKRYEKERVHNFPFADIGNQTGAIHLLFNWKFVAHENRMFGPLCTHGGVCDGKIRT